MTNDNHKEFEHTPEASVQEAPKKEVKVGAVDNCAKLNVRVSPKLTADVLTIIDKGTKVTLSEKQPKNKEWYRVCLEDGKEGFCMSKFIAVQ